MNHFIRPDDLIEADDILEAIESIKRGDLLFATTGESSLIIAGEERELDVQLDSWHVMPTGKVVYDTLLVNPRLYDFV